MQKNLFSGAFVSFSPELHFIAQSDCEEVLDLDLVIQEVFPIKRLPKNTYIAVRFTKGAGTLLTRAEENILCTCETVYFDLVKNILKIAVQRESCVHLYLFSVEKLLPPFQPEKLFSVRYSTDEMAIFEKLLSSGVPYDSLYRSMVNHFFAVQIFNWKRQFELHASFENETYAVEIKKAVAYIEENLYNKISFSLLSEQLHLSERNFRKVFKAYLGVSPKAYMQERRMETAAEMLRQGKETISEISEMLGYYSQYQFSRDFKKHFEISPSQYKKIYNPRL